MSEIDEAVRSIYNLHGLLILGYLNIIVPSFVVLVDECLDFLFFVPAWNILNHYICACFHALDDSLGNYRANFIINLRVIVRVSGSGDVCGVLPIHVEILTRIIVLRIANEILEGIFSKSLCVVDLII